MTHVPCRESKRTTLSSTPIPVSAHGASSSPTRRTASVGLAGVAIDIGSVPFVVACVAQVMRIRRGRGASVSRSRAASRAAAVRRTTRSPCWGPTSCRPIGRPPLLRPAQHGGRRRPGHVERIGELDPVGGHLPVDRARSSRRRTAPPPSTSASPGCGPSWKSSTRRRFMRWKRSKICSSCSAVVDWAASTQVAQHGVDLVPPRVPHVAAAGCARWQAPVKVRKSPTGSASKTGSSTTTSAPSDSSTPTARSQTASHLGVHGRRSRASAPRRCGAGRGGRRAPPATRPRGGAGERRSVGSGPTATSRARATSAMRRAMGPLVDRSSQPGGFGPPAGTRPRLGLHAREAAAGRGDPDGAAAVGSGGERDHARRQRGRRPARGPARPRGSGRTGSAVGPKMVLVVLPDPAEFGRVGLADHDASGRPQAGDEGVVRGGGRVVGVERRAVGGACSRPRPGGP